MKFLFFLYTLTFINNCNSAPLKVNGANGDASVSEVCNENYDSLLIKYASDFTDTTIDLSKSLSPQLDSFMLHVDTICLRQQKEYRFFIAAVLAKLFYCHVIKGHQGYDLQSMEQRGAKVIIHEFKKIAGYESQQLEMLNSAAVVTFIQNDKVLSRNPVLENIVKQIKAQADLVDKRNKNEINH